MEEPNPPKPASDDPNALQIYKVVSDVYSGVNFRRSDNLYQALAIVVCLVLGIPIGAIAIHDHLAGAIVGGFVGLLAGLFGSGIFLMIYRLVQHLKGRHD